ncbi:hypothetical protein [Salinicoccus sp. RF5]|uniref:hypothetical protein n=1 Tax=Salinicoccus sp. RF5 TaxID=2748874 RepID=UPI001E4A8684|nr:hypothetical protein [Salinicoccus sp. RF5]MCC4722351.1 hypothetical protein [Salinicoccus sp. RF5]
MNNDVGSSKKNGKIIIGIIGLIICIVTSILIASISPLSYSIMFLIPLIYGFLTFFPGQLLKYISWSPGIICFMSVSFIRYFITPLVTALSGMHTVTEGRYTSDQYYTTATFLLLYEMIIVYFIAFWTLRKQKFKQTRVVDSLVTKKSQFIIIVFILIAILIVLINPSVLRNYNFVFTPANNLMNSEDYSHFGFLTLFINTAKLLIPLLFIYYGKMFYDKTQKFTPVILALFPSFIIIMFAEGNRRGALIVPFILTLLISIKMFPKYRRRILVLMGGTAVSILLYMTMQKSIVSQSIETSMLKDQINWFATYLDSYFAFIKHTAIAIETSIRYDETLGVSTLINDIFYPFPYFGGELIDGNARSTIFFNYTFYNNTLITDRVIPSVGQGTIYGGYIFSPLFSAIFTKLALEADGKYKLSKDIFEKFLWGYTAWLFASSINANINLLTQTLFQVILPLVLVYVIYKRVALRKYQQ